jgi:hypothetical protein
MMKKNVCHSQFWFVIHYFQLIFLFLAFPASQASPAIKPLKTGLPDYLDYKYGGKNPFTFFSCSQSKKK